MKLDANEKELLDETGSGRSRADPDRLESVIVAYTVDMPRSRAIPLITRGDRIKSLGIDLARELARQDGQGLGAHAMAAGLKREVDAVLRVLKRPKPPKAPLSGA